MEYQKNREVYKPITLRIKKTDIDILQWVSEQKSVNASIMRLIRDDAERLKQMPEHERIRQFELIEEHEPYKHHVLSSFDTIEDAVRALVDHVQTFEVSGKIYISERFTGILPNGKKIKASKIIKAFEDDRGGK